MTEPAPGGAVVFQPWNLERPNFAQVDRDFGKAALGRHQGEQRRAGRGPLARPRCRDALVRTQGGEQAEEGHVLGEGAVLMTGTVEEVKASDDERVQDLLNRRIRRGAFDSEAYLARLTKKRDGRG